MDDLLIFLISVIAEALVDAFLEIVGGLVISFLVRTSRRLFSAVLKIDPLLMAVSLVILGAAIGFLSVLIFPHPLIHPSPVHGASLLISPVVTGLVMSQIGRVLRRRGRESTQIESFGYGFVFALAMALVRFTLAK
jgi:hypothetical protein